MSILASTACPISCTKIESTMDHAADAHRTDLMTITRFVLNEQTKHPESRGDFSILLSHIVLGCKFVCTAVNKVFYINFSVLIFCFHLICVWLLKRVML